MPMFITHAFFVTTLIAITFAPAVGADSQAIGDPPPAMSTRNGAAPGFEFESAGLTWRLLPDYVALLDESRDGRAPNTQPDQRSDTHGVVRDLPRIANRHIVKRAENTRSTKEAGFEPNQGQPVVWNAYQRRYGILTGEVLAYTARGAAGPREGLPAGLSYAQAFPDLGITSYQLSTTDLSVVDALSEMPGVEGTRIVVKTQRVRTL